MRGGPEAAEVAGTLRAVPPYYLTTPIYYVNDAPHVGTAYTTVNADALARWHRLLGDDVWFMTGTDEHGAKIVEAAEANGVTPKEWTDRTSARFVEAWNKLDIANDDFIRTTEPRHYAVVQQFLQRIYDNGFIELAPYSGLYCISCEDYYTEDQLIDGKCPLHGRPVVEMQEDNYFFKLSAFEQPLLDYYEAHPDFVRPVSKRNEALGLHSRRVARCLHHEDLVHVGRAGPLGQRPRFLCLVRRADQLPHGGRLRQRRGRLRRPMGRRTPPAGQGHLEVPLRLVAGHVHGSRHRAAGRDLRARLPADGGTEARQDDDRGGAGRRRAPLNITDVSPLALADDFGVDPLRYHLLREVPLGGDGDFSYEGIVARYNSDLANNLGNLVSRHHRGPVEVRRGRPAPIPRVSWRSRRPASSRRRRPPGSAGRPTRRSRRPGA